MFNQGTSPEQSQPLPGLGPQNVSPSSSGRTSIYSINLPPQYRHQEQQSYQYPDVRDMRMPFEALSDDQAIKIIRADYETAMNYRYQNHDWRWVIADALYTGWKQSRFWEGTRIPRANVSVMVDFEQIESMMPKVMGALFNEQDWFEAVARGKTTPKAARQIRDILQTQLHDCNPQEVVRRVCKSGVIYGNGIMAVCWDYQVRRRLQFTPQFIPKMNQSINPIDNIMQQMPSGSQFDRRIVEQIVEEYINRPCWKYISLKRFFIDPNAPSPVPSESQFCGYESYMSVEELMALKDQPGFESMPDEYTLWRLSKLNSYSQSDMTQSEQEASRRSNWMPWVDQSSDPAAARIKVIHYFTKNRIIWSLNNRYVVYNKPCPIGRITFHDAFYADLLDRFYAMAVSDVVEPEQRVQEGLLNSRLDELSLAIHPTTVKQRGSGTPLYQVRVRPGGVAESSDPKNDVIRQYPMNATQNAFLEAQASELRVQRYTGVTDLAMIGVGTANNPAAKTATGAGIQGQASASRVIYFVENVERLLIEPALDDTFQYDLHFLDPNQMIQGAQAGDEPLDPIVLFGADVRFEMRASSRMQSRQALLSLMPLTLQAMLNPQLLAQLAAMGQTIDFVEMMQMFMDASGYRKKFSWIRQLTPQEQQMMHKPTQAESDMALQQNRMSSLSQMQLNKQEMEILRDILVEKTKAALMPKEDAGATRS
jgi:hypothetical protein